MLTAGRLCAYGACAGAPRRCAQASRWYQGRPDGYFSRIGREFAAAPAAGRAAAVQGWVLAVQAGIAALPARGGAGSLPALFLPDAVGGAAAGDDEDVLVLE